MSTRGGLFARNQRGVARAAFGWRRAGVGGAVLAWKGTVDEAQHWIGIHGQRNCLASTFMCPKFLGAALFQVGQADAAALREILDRL